jgi:hypothetical protein
VADLKFSAEPLLTHPTDLEHLMNPGQARKLRSSEVAHARERAKGALDMWQRRHSSN